MYILVAYIQAAYVPNRKRYPKESKVHGHPKSENSDSHSSESLDSSRDSTSSSSSAVSFKKTNWI